MTKKEALQLFEERKIRTVWDDVEEKWYFSIVDVCGILTDQPDYEHYPGSAGRLQRSEPGDQRRHVLSGQQHQEAEQRLSTYRSGCLTAKGAVSRKIFRETAPFLISILSP